MIDIEKLKALALAATPGPWRGDRMDGTVKYWLIGANDEPVIRGDNGNSESGPFGIDKEEDEAYLLGCHPAAMLELIAEVERLRAELASGAARQGGDTSDSGIGSDGAAGTVEKDAARPDFFKWWTSIETDVRKSMLVWASRDRERLHALLRLTFDAAIEAHNKAGKEQG